MGFIFRLISKGFARSYVPQIQGGAVAGAALPARRSVLRPAVIFLLYIDVRKRGSIRLYLISGAHALKTARILRPPVATHPKTGPEVRDSERPVCIRVPRGAPCAAPGGGPAGDVRRNTPLCPAFALCGGAPRRRNVRLGVAHRCVSQDFVRPPSGRPKLPPNRGIPRGRLAPTDSTSE